VIREASAVLTESEKPLGYAATLVTILGVATFLGYALSLLGVEEVEAAAFGLLSALLGLAIFYLVVAMRRGSRSSSLIEAAAREKAAHQGEVGALADQLAAVRKETAAETRRLQDEISARDSRITTLTAEATAARREAEAERKSTERAKVAPAMDPFYRFEGHLIRQDHYWVGVENKGLGPAENVTLSIEFKGASGVWRGNGNPYVSVLEKGERKEFEMGASHFDRNPTELTITVEYEDLTGMHHSKGVRYILG
jgi:hypothetical protein